MKDKKEDIRPITYNQIKYLKRLIKYSNQGIRNEDIEKCDLLKSRIEEIGIENLTLQLAKEYIATFVEFDKLYQEQYEEEARTIDNSVKTIDFSKYRKI